MATKKASRESEVVVWAFLNDRLQWSAYAPEVCQHLEHAQAFGHQQTFQLGTVTPTLAQYEVNFQTMRQKQLVSGTERPIQRLLKNQDSSFYKGFQWVVEGDLSSEWIAYDVETVRLMDARMVKLSKQQTGTSKTPNHMIDLRLCNPSSPYLIDLSQMTQTRVDTGRRRRIDKQKRLHAYPSPLPSASAAAANTGLPGAFPVQGGAQTLSSPKQRNKRRAQPYVLPFTAGQGSTVKHTSGGSAVAAQQVTVQAPGPQVVGQMGVQPMIAHPGSFATPMSQATTSSSAQLVSGNPQHSQLAVFSSTASRALSLLFPIFSNQSATSPEFVTESLPLVKKVSISEKKNNTKSKTGKDVLAQFIQVLDITTGRGSHDEVEDCSICFDKLTEVSSYGVGHPEGDVVVRLTRCGHVFHKLCLLEMYNSMHKNDSLQCPSCKTFYGEKIGNCPSGYMTWTLDSNLTLAGYEGHGTIVVSYQISGGVQGPDHPSPGEKFSSRGFPRQGYIPDCNKGRKVLKLLIEAFSRRLMFTIGTSYTTGEPNTVTWNEIHLKTEPLGNMLGHGFPDPNYLDNTILELAAHGVTEDCLK